MNDQVPTTQARDAPPSKSNALIVVGVFLGICLLIGFILPELGAAHEPARRMNCMLNLKQIGMLITMYTKEHDGKIPETFDDLHPYIVNNILLICPSAKDRIKPSYQILLGGLQWNSVETSNAVAVTEPLTDHRIGRNALYGDGRVEFKPEP